MRITLHLDVGQLLISSLIAIVGWFIKREITVFGNRLDKHEELLRGVIGSVQRLIGYYNGLSAALRVPPIKDDLDGKGNS